MTSPQAIAPEPALNEVKLARVKRASYTRKPNAVFRISDPKPFSLSMELREQTLERLVGVMSSLRFNIKFVALKRGSNVSQLCRDLHSVGIMVSREGIVRGGGKRSVQLTYVTTMSIALNVPVWVLLHPDIASIWDSLNLD
jgi:hypothetical protein